MPHHSRTTLSLLLSGAAVSGPLPHSQGPSTPTDVVELTGPRGSVTPNLAAVSGGRLVLTWLEPLSDTGSYGFRFAIREPGGAWSRPGTIREGKDFFVNWADFGSLAETGDGRWIAHWLQKTAAAPYAYHVMLSVSSDRGATWSAPVRAHQDSSATEHGFVAMSGGPSGLDLVWLDGRNMAGEARGAMTIRTRSLGSGNRLAPEIELDARTCECCQTALTRGPDGLIAAYRDRSDAEIRDIAVIRQVGGRWQPPQVVAKDGWEYRACPVNGPALTAHDRRVDLAWFTGVNGEPRVWLVRSTDGGATFGNRIRIDQGQTLGRVDVEPLGDGAVLVAWLEGQSDREASWQIRRVTDAGAGPARAVATVPRARLAGFPRLARTPDGVFLAFTVPGVDGGVRVLRLAGESGRRSTAQP